VGSRASPYHAVTTLKNIPCLDHNATTPLSPHAAEAYGYGQRLIRQGILARPKALAFLMARARAQIAAHLGAFPDEILFTSGGTEANALVLAGACAQGPQVHLCVSALEHPSVGQLAAQYASRAQARVSVMPANGDGVCDVAHVPSVPPPQLVSLTHASNETGVVQPVAALAQRFAHANTWVHTDAVQALGRIPVDFAALQVDFLTLAGHKIGAGGTQGALVIRRGVPFAPPLWTGVTQDADGVWQSPSACNLPGALALAAAMADLPNAYAIEKTARVRDAMEAHLQATCGLSQVLGQSVPRLPNTCAIRFIGCRAETLMVALDVQGIAISQGAACSSGATTVSPGIAALGLTEVAAREVLRISLSMDAQTEHIAELCRALPPLVAAIRRG
jgi:cysteine desulfurase